MRIVFVMASRTKDILALNTLKDHFQDIANHFAMDWNMFAQNEPVRTLLMVSKEDHCLHDLLYRTAARQLNIQVTGIVSNHDTCRNLADHYDITYHHLPITPQTKDEQESVLKSFIAETDTKLIVLARYMQILSSHMCAAYSGRMINIHHSFLPGFKGARPYHQAYKRGVKMIGATAHFVTPDLDEGPIIEQDTLRITHADSADDLRNKGRDIESSVLSAAVKHYADRRVFLHGDRTVIL